MAVKLTDEFGNRANPSSAAYPNGSLKDETNPGVSNDGSPLSSRVGNDFQGFMQSALAEAGIDANGNPDSVDNPQILNALKKIQENHASTYTDIVYKASGGKSAIENMVLGNPISANDGDILSTGSTLWIANSSNQGLEMDNGLFAQSITPRSAKDYGLSSNNIQPLIDAQDGSGEIQYTDFGSRYWANGVNSGSAFNVYNFAGQGQSGRSPIGFIYHHYTDNIMVQMDNVGANNDLLVLKNANNPVRRADKPADFIGSANFLKLRRNEPDGNGGVTPTKDGFFISKDFELVWPQQTSGTETVRLWNNIPSGSNLWTHELKNSFEQRYLLRLRNGTANSLEVEWVTAANSLTIASEGLNFTSKQEDVNFNAPNGLLKFNQVMRLDRLSRGQLPNLTSGDVGCIAYLLDGSDKFPIHWDGQKWVKVSDNTAI